MILSLHRVPLREWISGIYNICYSMRIAKGMIFTRIHSHDVEVKCITIPFLPEILYYFRCLVNEIITWLTITVAFDHVERKVSTIYYM